MGPFAILPTFPTKPLGFRTILPAVRNFGHAIGSAASVETLGVADQSPLEETAAIRPE